VTCLSRDVGDPWREDRKAYTCVVSYSAGTRVRDIKLARLRLRSARLRTSIATREVYDRLIGGSDNN
jgi:hypothetical protein